MAVIQLNPVGLGTTDNGYISSITVYYNGQINVLTPSVLTDGTYGQVSLTGTGAAQATTRLVGGVGNVMGAGSQAIKLVTG